MKTLFYPTDITYTVKDGKPIIQVYGRDKDGKQICVLDYDFKPYFYVVGGDKKELEHLKKEDYKVTTVEKVTKNLNEHVTKAYKVYVNMPKGVPVMKDLAKALPDVEGVYEYDILFPRRYILDKGITPLTLTFVEGQEIPAQSRVTCIRAEVIGPESDEVLKPKMLSVDIETYNPTNAMNPQENPILMVGLYGEGFSRVITWKKFNTKENYIEFVQSEADMLQRFVELVEEFGPDFLIGYFTDGFDFPYMVTRAKINKVKLDIGLDYSQLQILGRQRPEAKVNGIAHIDTYKFIRKVIGRSLKTDVYSLNAVSEELLGEKKHDISMEEFFKVWDEGSDKLEEYCKYNLQDVKLTYDLTQKILPNLIEFVRIVRLPPYDINRMTFSTYVEWFLINQAHDKNEILLNRPNRREENFRLGDRIKGAFVYEPKPGFYKDIVVFDYRSLYPSLIASLNISRGTLNCDCCKDTEKIETERGTLWYCKKKKGLFSVIIRDLILRRSAIKKLMKQKPDPLLAARSEALKVLANSFYGYMGFAPARWYCIECAESTTAWARYYIQKAIKTAEQAGFKVLYSDSLPCDRKIFVQNPEGEIELIKIGELYKRGIKKGYKTLAYEHNQTKFMPLKRVIKHKYGDKGKLLKITTKYGTTIVTNQHSVYTYDKKLKLVNAEKLKKGDHLISLTNPKIKVKYRRGHVFDLTELELGEYSEKLRLYNDCLEFPAKRGICPYCKKNVYLSSHVNLQHKERKQKLQKKSKYEYVGAVNAKIGKIPRYWELDEDLAWLLGYYCADGSVSDVQTKTGRKCLLSFGSQKLKIIERVKKILDRKIETSLQIIKNYDKRNKKHMYYYRVQRRPLVALFKNGFGAGKRSEFKKVPEFIFTSEEKIRKAFVQGYLEGDGNQQIDKRYVTHFKRFSTKSKKLAIGLQFILKSLKHGNNKFGKSIRHIAWNYRKDKPKINNLRLQSAKKCEKNFCLAEIKEIKTVPRQKYVYDLEVEGSHNFVDAEGMILVHNTDSVFLLLEEKSKKDAQALVDGINKDLPGLMELEYEGYYPAGIFVGVKSGEGGAKKKYALVDEQGDIIIKGFETVRRNYSYIAKDVQSKVLSMVLREHDPKKAKKYVKQVIEDMRNNKVPIDKVVIKTAISKAIEDYAAIGPHVAAAKRMKARGEKVGPGTLVRYVVVKGKGKIRDKVKLPDEIKQEDYDGEYYITHQIIPGVEKIFAVLDISVDDLTSESKQSSLDSF